MCGIESSATPTDILHACAADPTQHQQLNTAFTPIDSDPHFKRVVSYFRPSDYVAWAGATAAFPSALYLMGQCMTASVTTISIGGT